GLVQPLSPEQLTGPSYASEWPIAQVLSHLGSQAEIFDLVLDAGLTGQEPPGREQFEPIWASWNHRTPPEQAADGLRADRETLERFESLSEEERDSLHVHVFGAERDAGGLARMRVSEHALHTWDVAVVLDPAATVAPDAVDLLVDTMPQVTGRASKPDGTSRQVTIDTSQPERRFTLETTADAVTLEPASPAERNTTDARIRLPAEALIRLVYGRLDPAHTPQVDVLGADLDELRRIFPGF
ncbi:MAG: maleylpyruvate isomerase family mycothiol-dependent enzyme, partial [Acidimicrobiales bacterium]